MRYETQKFRPSFGAAQISSDKVTAANAQQFVNQQLPPPPSEADEYAEYISYFNQSAEGLNKVLFGKDPRVAAAIKKAMITNLEGSVKKYGKYPVIGDYFKGKLRTAKAEYNALAKQAETAELSETLGVAIKGGAVIVTVSLVALLLSNIALARARTRAVTSGA
jgi:hypothetical protein